MILVPLLGEAGHGGAFLTVFHSHIYFSALFMVMMIGLAVEGRAELGLGDGDAGARQRGLGLVAWRRGDLEAAQAQLQESLRLYQEVGDKRYIAMVHNDLGQLAHARGDARPACRGVPASE